MTPAEARQSSTFQCFRCKQWVSYTEFHLDGEERAICQRCYLDDPPACDVNGIFAEVAAGFEPPPAAIQKEVEPPPPPKAKRIRKSKAGLLTELGEALGCPPAAKVACAKADPDSRLPEACWYTGPLADLGPAPDRTPTDSLEAPTLMDLDGRAVAARGRADIIRYCELRRRIAERGARRRAEAAADAEWEEVTP